MRRTPRRSTSPVRRDPESAYRPCVPIVRRSAAGTPLRAAGSLWPIRLAEVEIRPFRVVYITFSAAASNSRIACPTPFAPRARCEVVARRRNPASCRSPAEMLLGLRQVAAGLVGEAEGHVDFGLSGSSSDASPAPASPSGYSADRVVTPIRIRASASFFRFARSGAAREDRRDDAPTERMSIFRGRLTGISRSGGRGGGASPAGSASGP